MAETLPFHLHKFQGANMSSHALRSGSRAPCDLNVHPSPISYVCEKPFTHWGCQTCSLYDYYKSVTLLVATPLLSPHQALYTCSGPLARSKNTHRRAKNGDSAELGEMANSCYAVEEKERADRPSFASHPVSEHGTFHGDCPFHMNPLH